MKRTLTVLLAVIFILGIASVTLASPSPFSDVPENHWAYDAIAKLAKSRIVHGYSDGTYRGDAFLSRYEMAIITANAMTKMDRANAADRALIEKLAAEFSDELKSLDARVTKIEKTMPKVQTYGDIRLRYQMNQSLSKTSAGGTTVNRLQYRLRQGFTYNPADDVVINARISAENRLTDHRDGTNSVNDQLEFDVANIKFLNAFGGDLTLGRQMVKQGSGLMLASVYIDAARFDYGSKAWKQYLLWGDGRYAPGTNTTDAGNSKVNAKSFVTYGNQFAVSKDTNLYAAYLASTVNNDNFLYKNVDLSFDTKMSTDLKLSGEWVRNNYNTGVLAGKADKSAWLLRLDYKGANRNIIGSSGFYISYRKVGHYSFDPSLNAMVIDFVPYSGTLLQSYQKSYQGTSLGYSIAVRKNTILSLSMDSLRTWGVDSGTKYDPAYYFQLNSFW